MRSDRRLEMAEALLAKARSTTFAPEQILFARAAWEQLDAFLCAEPGTGDVIDLRDGVAAADGVAARFDSDPDPTTPRPGGRVDVSM